MSQYPARSFCFQSPTNAHAPLLRVGQVVVGKVNALDASQSNWRQSFGGLARANDVLEANIGALKLDVEANCPRALSAERSCNLEFFMTREVAACVVTRTAGFARRWNLHSAFDPIGHAILPREQRRLVETPLRTLSVRCRQTGRMRVPSEDIHALVVQTWAAIEEENGRPST
jgi:hypothetical protein